MSQHAKEFSLAVLLLIILLAVINPGHIWMPNMLTMSLAVFLLFIFSLFTLFVLGERPADEREQLHKLLVSRSAFLIGGGLLSLGILVQSISHNIDPWLVYILGAMILTKVIGMIWARKKR